MDKRVVVAFIALLAIFSLVSFWLGFLLGVDQTIEYGVKVVHRLIELDKLNIIIDEQMLINGIIQYKNNIGGCLFIQNASLSAD